MPEGQALKDTHGIPIFDFFTQAPLGAYPQMSMVNIQGRATNAASAFQVIWPVNSVYSYPSSITAANSLAIASVNSGDIPGGFGAGGVLITGLDTGYNIVTETVSLQGTTPVPLTQEFWRVNQIKTESAGVFGFNLGKVSIGTGTFSAGEPAIAYSIMTQINNISTAGVYTVPGSYTLLAYPPNVYTENADMGGTILLRYRLNGGIFTQDFEVLANAFVNRGRKFTDCYGGKTDLQFAMLGVTSQDNVVVNREAVLVKNGFFKG